jgi:hypothetical protein
MTGGVGGDLFLAIGLSVTLVVSLAAEDLLRGADNLLETACAVGAFCCLIPRRADPQLSAIAAAILFAASAALGSLATIPSELGDLIAVPAFLLAYSLGDPGRSAAADHRLASSRRRTADSERQDHVQPDLSRSHDRPVGGRPWRQPRSSPAQLVPGPAAKMRA